MSDTPARRRDTERNRRELLIAAATMLRDGERLTASAVAARAGLARATVYRHFPTVGDLAEAAAPLVAAVGASGPAESGPFDLHTLLQHVSPDRVADAIVAAARRCGEGPVGLYLADIDGSRLLRCAGDAGLPDELRIPAAVGPEIPIGMLEALHDAILTAVAQATVAPLVIRDRAIGVLVGVAVADPAALQRVARDAAVAVVINSRFTDVIRRARRHRPTTAAAETQQLLLAPRVAQMTGLRFAGHVQPGYENGGNWFDHAENDDGAWIAAVDTLGTGARAAAISAVVLGALRADRHAGSTPSAALQTMHRAVREVDLPGARCSAWVARWHSPSSHLFWATAGDLSPQTLGASASLQPLAEPGPPLGGDRFPAPVTHHRRLQADELVLLLSDGVFGGAGAPLDRPQLEAAVHLADSRDPATLVSSLLATVARGGALRDDAMVVAFGPTGAGRAVGPARPGLPA